MAFYPAVLRSTLLGWDGSHNNVGYVNNNIVDTSPLLRGIEFPWAT